MVYQEPSFMVVEVKCVNAIERSNWEQLGALGLVVNAITLWNTYYMDVAVDRLRLNQMAIDPKDLARLSPLGRSHLNILGRYQFGVSLTNPKIDYIPSQIAINSLCNH
jgi:hypothetical protein